MQKFLCHSLLCIYFYRCLISMVINQSVSHLNLSTVHSTFCSNAHPQIHTAPHHTTPRPKNPDTELVTYSTHVQATVTRGSHLHVACRSVCDRDQNGIKRSRSFYKTIKQSSDQGRFTRWWLFHGTERSGTERNYSLKCGTAKSRNMVGGADCERMVVAGFCGEARHMETRR